MKRFISLICVMVLVMGTLLLYAPKSKAYNPRTGIVNGISVNVRYYPVTGYAFCQLDTGDEVTVVDEDMGADGYIWYNITFDMDGYAAGWIRSDYVSVATAKTTEVTDASFESKLNAQGFPESYKQYLRTLHQIHPNWNFTALQVGIDWNTVIANEIAVTSRNLIPATCLNSWKSLEAGAYDWNTNTWFNYEAGWVAASKEIIEYYMDPRNFLVNDARILMFMTQNWTGSETKAGVQSILSGTAMGNSGEDFAQYFINAGSANGISAYHLATRAIQETAGGASGSVTGYWKNYYNIGAYGEDPVAAAVSYAAGQGWNTAAKSITGGAAFMKEEYIDARQNTLYLEKWDVVDGGNGYYWHQYMGNILAPETEALGYASQFPTISDEAITFIIPVYNNMPADNVYMPSSDGNPNNLLKSLSVSGYSLTPSFNKFKNSYDVIVPTSVTSVTISATPQTSSTIVSGLGNRALNSTGTTALKVVCTPSYGPAREYVINVARGSGGTTPVTPPSQPTVSKGDINNDGLRNVVDLVMMKKHIVGIEGLGGNQFTAADINGDGAINVVDLVMLKKHIVGIEYI